MTTTTIEWTDATWNPMAGCSVISAGCTHCYAMRLAHRLAAFGQAASIIGINDWYFFPKVAAVIVFQRIIGPVLLGRTTDEAAVATALPEGRICIAELDRLLGARPFLAGERLSIADLVLAPRLDFFAAMPEGTAMLAGTGLGAWLGRMRAHPSMLATQRPRDAGHT